MKTRLLIFDFDGTLADTRAYIVRTMQQAMREMGREIPEEDACAATIGLPLKGCFQQLYPGISDADAEECMTVYRRIFDQNRQAVGISLFPGVKETMEQLWKKGYLLSVASSRSTRTLNEFLEEEGIAPWFSLVIGANQVQHAKPHPEPVLITLEALSVPAGEALVVGDMPVDILMGAGAGTRTCGVTYGNSSRAELLATGATFVIDRFADLQGIL
jgi:phosphoglycolate phosphatase